MGKIAVIFPGQGAQKAGMGKAFYERYETARKIFDEAGETLGFDMPQLCFEENNRLDLTEYTQCAMVTTSLAMLSVMKENGFRADVAAGLSLGEYCALAAAGVMENMDAVRTVRKRGILMQEAVPAGIGAMAAVLAMPAEKIEEVLNGMEGVQIANYNCPGQIVISGLKEAVGEACEKLAQAGAKRCIPLNVSGPFHSWLLKEAGEKLGEILRSVELKEPEIPYVANVNAEYIREKAPVKELLKRQIASSVRWQQSVETMLAEGVDTFVEVGPGKTLSGFIKKISRQAKVWNVELPEDMEKVLAELA